MYIYHRLLIFIALEKVDGQISAFMVQLKERLFEFPSVLEEKRRLIRYFLIIVHYRDDRS